MVHQRRAGERRRGDRGASAGGIYDCVLKYDIYGSPIQATSAANPCVSEVGNAKMSLTELAYQFTQRDPTTGAYTFATDTTAAITARFRGYAERATSEFDDQVINMTPAQQAAVDANAVRKSARRGRHGT